MRRVVVTGLGAVTPIGNNMNEYWNGLVTGVNGIAPITRFPSLLYLFTICDNVFLPYTLLPSATATDTAFLFALIERLLADKFLYFP